MWRFCTIKLWIKLSVKNRSALLPAYMWQVFDGRMEKDWVQIKAVLSSAYMIGREISSLINHVRSNCLFIYFLSSLIHHVRSIYFLLNIRQSTIEKLLKRLVITTIHKMTRFQNHRYKHHVNHISVFTFAFTINCFVTPKRLFVKLDYE